MKSRTVKRTRIVAVLVMAILLATSLGVGISLWQANKAYANDGKWELTNVAIAMNIDLNWIFTSDTPNDMLYRMVTVTVTYETASGEGDEGKITDTYELEFSGEASKEGYTAKTGEVVTFSRNGGTVTVTVVTLKPDATLAGGASNEASENFGLSDTTLRTQIGIYAEFNSGKVESYWNINSGTKMNNTYLSAIDIYQMFNDGSRVLDTTGGQYTLSGDFFPEDLYEFLNKVPRDDKYNKILTVIDNNNSAYTTTVEWKDITFAEPDEFDGRSINGNLAQQYARSEFNMDGLTVNLWYNSTRTSITVPLSAFKGYLGTDLIIKYYSSANVTGSTLDKLTTEVHSIEIELTYPKTSKSIFGTFVNITVAPLAIHAPDFPNMTGVNLSWNDGASIDIKGWDYAELYKEDPPAPIIKAWISADEEYSSDAQEDSKKLKTELKNEDGVWVLTVHFPRPGAKYVLKVELPAGDFQWQSPPASMPYVTKSEDNLTLQIEVQVDKGTPTVTVTDMTGVTYGQLKGAKDYNGLQFTATLQDGEGKDVAMPDTWTYDPLGQDSITKHLNHTDCYYYLKFYTAYTSENVNTPVTDLLADGMPRNAGTYYVVLQTYENFGYKAVQSAVYSSFKIEKFTIYTSTTDETFARTEWPIAHFLDEGKNTFPNYAPYNETADKVINISGITKNNNSITDGIANYKFYNAGKYDVTLTIPADNNYSTNYKFENESTTVKVTFTIKTDKSSDFEFDASGWKYGKEDANPNISITSKTDPYYASDTHDINKDYTIKYYHFDGSKPNNVGNEVTEKEFKKFEVGSYVIELIANADTSYKSQHPAFTESTEITSKISTSDETTYDYGRPVQYKRIEVVAEDIEAPTLAAPWVLNTLGAVAGQVHRYNGQTMSFGFANWLTNNISAGGPAIITVEIKYTTFNSNITKTYVFDEKFNKTDSDTVTFDKGIFTVKEAGAYTVTISLNKNYNWKESETNVTTGKSPYSYIGRVERKLVTVLQDGDITNAVGENSIYNGRAQTKTISNWTDNVLQITNVTMGNLTGQTSIINNGYAVNQGTNTFYVTNAGKYTVSVDIKNEYKDNYEWTPTESETNVLRTLSLTYELEQALLKVKWWDGVTPDDYHQGSTDLSVFSFAFNGAATGEQQIPQAVPDVEFADDNGKLAIGNYIRYKYSVDNPFRTEVVGNKITAVGEYGIAVSAFGGDAAPNYKLPDFSSENATRAATVFAIRATKLDAPKLKDADGEFNTTLTPGDNDIKEYTVVYNGLDFTLTEYFNYRDYLIGKEYRVNYKVIAVKSGDDKTVKNANTYTVEITAGENYVWKDGVDSYKFNFIIEQRTVVIEWSNLTVDYNPKGENPAPKYTITNIAPDNTKTDKVSLVLAYKAFNAQSGADVTPTDAGKYLVYAKDLAGEQKGNYKIVEGTSNHSAEYTIRKFEVAAPNYDFGSTDFDGIFYLFEMVFL